jgi:hypothetical protein
LGVNHPGATPRWPEPRRPSPPSFEPFATLRTLVAQLDQAVTALLVIGIEPTGEAGADALAGSLDTILEQITALQQGLADTSSGTVDLGPLAALPSAPPTQPPPASPTP